MLKPGPHFTRCLCKQSNRNIPHQTCTHVCCVLLRIYVISCELLWHIHPYSSGLFHRHWGNDTRQGTMKDKGKIDPSHKSYNALDKYPTMYHFVTEICTHVDIFVTKWCIMEYMDLVHCGICATSLLVDIQQDRCAYYFWCISSTRKLFLGLFVDLCLHISVCPSIDISVNTIDTNNKK